MTDTSPQQTKEGIAIVLTLNSMGIGLGGCGSLKDHAMKVGQMQFNERYHIPWNTSTVSEFLWLQ